MELKSNKKNYGKFILAILLIATVSVVMMLSFSALADDATDDIAANQPEEAVIVDQIEIEAAEEEQAITSEEGKIVAENGVQDASDENVLADNAEEVANTNGELYQIVINKDTTSKSWESGVTWDKANLKLTLENANVTDGLKLDFTSMENITVEVIDTNNLTGPEITDSTTTLPSAGLYALSCNVSITGNGILNAVGNTAYGKIAAWTSAGRNAGIFLSNGSLSIDGPQINASIAQGKLAKLASYGIYCAGNFNVSGSSTKVTATAGKLASGEELDTSSTGIFVSTFTTISGGANVVAKADEGYVLSTGFECRQYAVITGSGTTVKATGANTTNTSADKAGGSYGFVVRTALSDGSLGYVPSNADDKYLIVSGGASLTGTAGTGGVYSDGIFCSYHMLITDPGTYVEANGGTSTNWDCNGLEIYDNELYVYNGAKLKSTAGWAARYSEGIYVEYGFDISGQGTVVEAYGGNSAGIEIEGVLVGGSFGLDTNQNEQPGDFVISDGAHVVAKGGSSNLNSCGMYSFYDDLRIDNATVEACGQLSNQYSCGISTLMGNVIITNGSKVNSYAEDSISNSIGIHSYFDFEISGQGTELIAKSGKTADEALAVFSEYGSVTIKDGAYVDAFAETADNNSLAIYAKYKINIIGNVLVKAQASYHPETTGYCTGLTAMGETYEETQANQNAGLNLIKKAYADTFGNFEFDISATDYSIVNCKEIDEGLQLDKEMTQVDFSQPITIQGNSKADTSSSAQTSDSTMPYVLGFASIALIALGAGLISRKRTNI